MQSTEYANFPPRMAEYIHRNGFPSHDSSMNKLDTNPSNLIFLFSVPLMTQECVCDTSLYVYLFDILLKSSYNGKMSDKNLT